jgi:hypothetical protein
MKGIIKKEIVGSSCFPQRVVLDKKPVNLRKTKQNR